jgi:low affinity Fe/Cu permease
VIRAAGQRAWTRAGVRDSGTALADFASPAPPRGRFDDMSGAPAGTTGVHMNDMHAKEFSLGTATARVEKAAKSESAAARIWFQRFAQRSSTATGSPWAFLLAVVVIVTWAITGPMFHFSNTWQLVINTGTTIVTFLMVFLIQNTQNRDAKAIHLKLDELIRAKKGARNTLVDLENCTDEELDQIEAEFRRLRRRADQNPLNADDVEKVEAH